MPPAKCSLKIPRVGRAAKTSRTVFGFIPWRNYLIFYTLGEDGITVARVLHGVRDYPHEFHRPHSPQGAPNRYFLVTKLRLGHELVLETLLPRAG